MPSSERSLRKISPSPAKVPTKWRKAESPTKRAKGTSRRGGYPRIKDPLKRQPPSPANNGRTFFR